MARIYSYAKGYLALILTLHRGSDDDDFVFPPTQAQARRRPNLTADGSPASAALGVQLPNIEFLSK
jgi:hypothetical protein